jgi:hypothetical protein
MNKFKVGDKLIGLPSASENYTITCEGVEGTVAYIYADDDIELRIEDGRTFRVMSKCFAHIKPNISEDALMSLLGV